MKCKKILVALCEVTISGYQFVEYIECLFPVNHSYLLA